MQRGPRVKRKIASILLSLVFGWLTTAALAEEESTTAADTTATASDTASPAEATTDTAMDTSTSDGTVAAAPAESDSK